MNINYCNSKLINWSIFWTKVSVKNVSDTISAKCNGFGNLYYVIYMLIYIFHIKINIKYKIIQWEREKERERERERDQYLYLTT